VASITLLSSASRVANTHGPFKGYGDAVDVSAASTIRVDVTLGERTPFPNWALHLWVEHSVDGESWEQLQDLGRFFAPWEGPHSFDRPAPDAPTRAVLTSFNEFVRVGYEVKGRHGHPLYPDSTREGPVFSVTGETIPDDE